MKEKEYLAFWLILKRVLMFVNILKIYYNYMNQNSTRLAIKMGS